MPIKTSLIVVITVALIVATVVIVHYRYPDGQSPAESVLTPEDRELTVSKAVPRPSLSRASVSSPATPGEPTPAARREHLRERIAAMDTRLAQLGVSVTTPEPPPKLARWQDRLDTLHNKLDQLQTGIH